MQHTLEIRHSSRSRAINRCALERLARRVVACVLDGERIQAAEVGILFVDTPAIQALNRQHRGADRPTDVIAFGLSNRRERRKPGVLLGDVVIAVPVAHRQARELAHPIEAEIALLLVHGVLHLLDYDHAAPHDARRMKAKERRYLKACGFPPL
ncbi:MAG: rRNA maturation RNase YbeY [Candidatus Sumerlaeia bacterium]|nr:rRNA maturation RNase YbeY [Candidatus Sumerlaeia bacterium]